MVERGERGERDRRERERGREAALEGRISIYAHSLACSICQLHADVTPPRAAHLPAATCPRPPSLFLPFPGNINRRAYYTMRCVPGSMEELLLLPFPLPFAFLTQNMQRRFWLPLVVFAFAPRCSTMGTKGGHKTFYAAFILLLHSRRKGEGARYCLKLYRECIRVNPPSYSAFALYVPCLRKHSNCLPYERRRTWKAKRKL